MFDNLIIDNAQISDIQEIYEIEKMSFDCDGFSLRQFRYLLTKSKGEFLAAKINKKIVAYIVLLKSLRSSKIRIYSIAVHPEFRGKNIADILINKSVEIAVKSGCSSITLEVKQNNNTAINFYKKYGFKIIGIKKEYYSDCADAIIMCYNIRL